MESNEIICKSTPNYSFLIGGKSPYRYNNNNFFFHSKEFLVGQDVVSFFILNNKEKLCDGVFNLSIVENNGYSPLKAPFGSIDINALISPKILEEFVDVILTWSLDHANNSISIKQYPQCYDPEGSSLVNNILFAKGFAVSNIDITQYLTVNQEPLNLSRSARIKLNKCRSANFVWEKMSSFDLAEIYSLIKDCKDRKNYPTNMSLHALEKKLKYFPNNYLLFGVKDDDMLISVAICVVTNKSILYDFSHAHHFRYDRFSPVIFLIDGIYNYCSENRYTLFDLGLSTENSVINTGLFEFKNRLGVKPSIKPSYFKNWKN